MALLFTAGLVVSIAKPAEALIAYRGASSADNNTGATTITIPTPAGATVGDVLIASIDFRAPAKDYSARNVEWRPVQQTYSNGLSKWTWALVLTSAPLDSYTFTIQDPTGIAYSSRATGGIIAYSGVNGANPIMSSGQQSNASNTTATSPSINTTSDNAMVVALFGAPLATSATAGSAMTERYDVQSSGGGGGASVKSTSAGQDAVQVSAGFSGAKTMLWASATTSIGHSVALNPAPIITQAAFRWYENSTTTGQVGDPLAPQDSNAAAPPRGTPFRLRMLLGVTGGSISAYEAFTLQYKWVATSCDGGVSYTTITSSSALRFYDNSGVSDGVAINTNANDPVRSGVTVVNQTYEEANDFSTSSTLATGQGGMWDFSLILADDAPEQGFYCLRAISANGVELGNYSQVPSLSLQLRAESLTGGNSRLYQNANAVNPGSPLAATNAGASLGSTGDQFRLRTGLGVSGYLNQISSGLNHSCGLSSEGTAFCWGSDASGQLGDSIALTNKPTATPVTTFGPLSTKTLTSISAGDNHTCAISKDSLAYCWGDDTYGQLGNDSSLTNQPTPVAVDTSGVLAGKTLLSISAGGIHTCAIASDNQAYCWGDDAYGQLGNDSSLTGQPTPVAVSTSGALSGKSISDISTGGFHSCAVTSEGLSYCWGRDAEGEMGDNTLTVTEQPTPVAVDTSGVLAGKTITSIASGYFFNCAVTTDGSAYCWGDDTDNVLGDNYYSIDQPTPVVVLRSLLPAPVIAKQALSLRLEFAQKTLGSCAIQTGFAAITTSSTIAYHDNTGAANAAAINLLADDPVSAGSATPQSYYDVLGKISNPSTLQEGRVGLWDFSLKDNGAPANTTYCLRLAGSDGAGLGAYESVAEITTASGTVSPDTNASLLRGGQGVLDGIKQLFSW